METSLIVLLILGWIIIGLIAYYLIIWMCHIIFPQPNDFKFHPLMIIAAILGPLALISTFGAWCNYYSDR